MDNHHASISPSYCSCGGLELSNLSEDSTKILYALATYLYHPSRGQPAAFVIWSDLDQEKSRGDNLYWEIKKLLGDGGIMVENKIENPKTSNIISFWFWKIPHETFREWWKKERIEKMRRL